MDSEHSAFLSASQRHHRYLVIDKKQRYIEVFQCSLEDMLLVSFLPKPAPSMDKFPAELMAKQKSGRDDVRKKKRRDGGEKRKTSIR